MILIYPEFELLKNYDKFVRRELDSTKELTYLFCYDIKNCLFKKDIDFENIRMLANEFLKDYKNV